MAIEKRLGRGLESLLGKGAEEELNSPRSAARKVPIGDIKPNPHQPREEFTERDLTDLAESIKSVGILQPLVVRRVGKTYELIAGERRLRAAKLAGLSEVSITERDASDDDMLTLALVENLQRSDLNAIEKAKAFKEMIERYSLTQEVAARRLGKDRATLANFIRLLDLPENVQNIVSRGTISMGHARALLSLPHPTQQYALAQRIEAQGLSVREVERTVAAMRGEKQKKRPRGKATAGKSPVIRDIEDRLREKFGTRVTIELKDGQGRLMIHLFSDDDLQRVLDVLGITE